MEFWVCCHGLFSPYTNGASVLSSSQSDSLWAFVDTLDQLYILTRILEGAWEFTQPVHMCYMDLEKAFDRVPQGVLWGT